ncbi:hypothetical protein SAMN04488109_1227 [Chryseolinea serpens]|uniref:Uncharacterized protein n=1 Tax=Chryseolinea serpens TaxID=947013 RepID=A0A1M5LJB0_9BACT|nr:hypothetical protein [Chryseolinea serpens]SHG64749.1 hypothetical protein SAMN04488109_1227 [Chryseolinea serpens]
MESKTDVSKNEHLELAKAFAVEELEERLEFGSWSLSAEASSNGTATAKATFTF